jgi:hypothetical protein
VHLNIFLLISRNVKKRLKIALQASFRNITEAQIKRGGGLVAAHRP